MNARVLLLVLMTGLFMASWRSDRCATQAALARQNRSESEFAADWRRRTPLVSSERTPTHRDEAAILGRRLTLAPNFTIPLEVEIPPGVYQAVSETGESHRLTVNSGHHGRTSVEKERNVFLARDSGAVRWYLIPISPENAL